MHWYSTAALHALQRLRVPSEEALEEVFAYVQHAWGNGGNLTFFAPWRANDPIFKRWWGKRFKPLGDEPGRRYGRLGAHEHADRYQRYPVSTIRAPTSSYSHRTEDVLIEGTEVGRYLAQHFPCVRHIEFPGNGTHTTLCRRKNADEIADAIEEFLTGSRAAGRRLTACSPQFSSSTSSRSTEKATALGDHRWRELLEKSSLRRSASISRSSAAEKVKRTGDGILATFDGPARGVLLRLRYRLRNSTHSELTFAQVSRTGVV